jgi:hypothetical protein
MLLVFWIISLLPSASPGSNLLQGNSTNTLELYRMLWVLLLLSIDLLFSYLLTHCCVTHTSLFNIFVIYNFNTTSGLMARYQKVSMYQYTWCKDRFDLIPFEMPSWITLDEVLQLCRDHIQQTMSPFLQTDSQVSISVSQLWVNHRLVITHGLPLL